MEKSLLEKLHSGNLDDIDKTMIACRVERAISKALEVCTKFENEFKSVQEEYDQELKIGQFSMVWAVGTYLDEVVTSDGGCGLMALVGSQPNLVKLVKEITEKINIKTAEKLSKMTEDKSE